jgi:CRP/FNR family cyclic AMP-dependent transcriptional regulator
MLSGIAALRQFRLFAELEEVDFESVGRISRVEDFARGEKLMTEGAPADEIYLFLKGRAVVKVRTPKGLQVSIDELGPGELLGWGAMMEPYVYGASAWITEPATTIVVNGPELRTLCETNRRIGYQVSKGIGEVMSKRLGRVVGSQQEGALSWHDVQQLRRFRPFAALDMMALDAVGRISRLRKPAAGERLTTEGAPADRLYLFLEGRATVGVRGSDGGEKVIDELGPGELLGWGAMMEPYEYTASAWTTEPSEVIEVDAVRLRELCETDQDVGFQVLRGIGEVISERIGLAVSRHGIHELNRFGVFSGLDLADLDEIAGISHIEQAAVGEELTTEGAPADRLYLLLSGEVEVRVRNPDGRQMLIDVLCPGEMLGWGVVVQPFVYGATARTVRPTEAIVVDGPGLRGLCDTNGYLCHRVTKNVGRVMARRFGHVVGSEDDLRAEDVEAMADEEHVIYQQHGLLLTGEAISTGVGGDSPKVIPLDAVLDVEVHGKKVLVRADEGDVWSPEVDDPSGLAALVRDAIGRTRYAQRRKDYYLGWS